MAGAEGWSGGSAVAQRRRTSSAVQPASLCRRPFCSWAEGRTALACPPPGLTLFPRAPSTPAQALLKVTLDVHGDVIAAHPELAERAQRTQQRLAATWRRLDGLLQSVRCMVGFLGNLQA